VRKRPGLLNASQAIDIAVLAPDNITAARSIMTLDITPMVASGRKIVTSYGDGLFRFGMEKAEGSILLFSTEVLAWPHTEIDSVDENAFAEVIARAGEIDILLLGMGARMQPVKTAWRNALRPHGIVIEPMDTGAACRTFNVLQSEERRVAAALIAV
jgi:uncharacterized protein